MTQFHSLVKKNDVVLVHEINSPSSSYMNNPTIIFSLIHLERPNNIPFLSRICELYSQPKTHVPTL